ncbi:ABC transporter ATP-binding protein/permease [Stomatohabitans albus]
MQAAQLTFWLLLPSIIAGLLTYGIFIAVAVLNAYLFTELLGQRNISRIVVLVVIIVALLLIRPIVGVIGQLLQNRAGLIVKHNLRTELIKELYSQGPMRMEYGRSGTIQSVVTDGVEAIESYFIKYFVQIIVTTVVAATLSIGIAQISLSIAFVLLLCGVSVVLIPRLWDKALAERGYTHWVAYEELNADFIDAMMGMATLKSFGAADSYGVRLNKQSHQLLTSTLGQLRLSLGESGLSGMMKVLGPSLGVIMAIFQVQAGTLPLSDMFLITMLSVEMFRPFNQLTACWHEAFFGISALTSMNAIFDKSTKTKIESPVKTISHNQVDIHFSNVSYHYIDSSSLAIDRVTFSIENGQSTALVGLSGSGKSTALGLLMGFDTPTQGTIRINDHTPNDIEISETIALVPQDPIIFPGTIREILLSANPEATEEMMLEVLAIAQADHIHDESNTLTSKQTILDLSITEHAKNLSGGQKQRLAIARALIRNTPVLVLDESTSAIDTQTEQMLLAALREARPNLTLLLVTHRIDTAAKTDHVIVMANGHVSCAGNPVELAKDPHSAWSELAHAHEATE